MLISHDDNIGCLCANANSLERLFTLPESRCFDYPTPHHLFRRPTFLFLYCSTSTPPPSPSILHPQHSQLTACPAVLDLTDDDEATGGSLQMLRTDCRLPSGSKTKPHYHKELSLLVGRVFTFFLYLPEPPNPPSQTRILTHPHFVQYHCCYALNDALPHNFRKVGLLPLNDSKVL